MPHKTKKKFIDKKKAVTFQLVHRSQKDPLAADDEAPQHVLVPMHECENEEDFRDETPRKREERLSKQRLYGIGFDDDYDYMQHLRQPEQHQATLVPKNDSVTLHDVSNTDSAEDFDEMTKVMKDEGGQSISLKLPSVVFASKEEEEIGMLHRAIPPIGPQVEWDPDIIAAMDEDFNFEDPENIIEDDFIIQATEGDDEDEDERSCDIDHMEEDSNNSDIHSWGSEKDNFEEEETRSRFTQYSMTSSVIPRNQHLSLLDDQFEKFYETYDDEKIGDLGQVEIDGTVPVDNVTQEDTIKMLLGIDDRPVQKISIRDEEIDYKGRESPERDSHDDSAEDDGDEDIGHMVEIEKKVADEKWDCESILSTYSNIYNHPRLIKDPPKAIKLSKKTGIPLDTLPTRGLTKKQLQTLDQGNEVLDEGSRNRTASETSNLTSIASNVRRKDETKEEKATRKQAVRECRRERRAEKKATKIAFRREKSRQNKEFINLQQNLNGIRIS